MTTLLLAPARGVETPGRAEIAGVARAHLAAGDLPSLAGVARAVGAPLEEVGRWFPSEAALLVEAALLGGLPDAAEVFGHPGETLDVAGRVERAGLLLHHTVCERARELPAVAVGRVLDLVLGSGDLAESEPAVEIPLIEAAVRPSWGLLAPATLRQLTRSVTLLVLARSLLVAWRLDDLQRRRTAGEIAWACRALVNGALLSAS